MKKLFLSICIIISSLSVFAQQKLNIDTIISKFILKSDSILKSYKCCTITKNEKCENCPPNLIRKEKETLKSRIFLDESLDSSFIPIFNTVILNNDNTINIGSAGAVSQDDKAGTINSNYAYKINFNNYFNIGFGAESNGSLFNIYSSNAWKSGISLNLGYTWIPRCNSQFFDVEKCVELQKSRKIMLNKFIVSTYINLDIKKTDEIRIKIKDLKIELGLDSEKVISDTEKLNKFSSDYKKFVENLALLDSLEKKLKERETLITPFANKDNDSLCVALVRNEVINFETKNYNYFNGNYHITWYNFGASFGNTTNKLYNDSLKTLINFTLTNYNRFKFFGNWNKAINYTNSLWFLKGSAVVYNSNFLENKKMAGLPYINYDSTKKNYVYISDSTAKNGQLGSLSELNKNIWILNPSFYTACFFSLKKSIGLEFSADYKLQLNRLTSINNENTYSTYLGVIFKVNKNEVFSKATISLDAGIYDAPVNANAFDYFSLRLKLGVPFNTFSKK